MNKTCIIKEANKIADRVRLSNSSLIARKLFRENIDKLKTVYEFTEYRDGKGFNHCVINLDFDDNTRVDLSLSFDNGGIVTGATAFYFDFDEQEDFVWKQGLILMDMNNAQIY